MLLDLFIEDYGNINIDYDNIDKNLKENLLNKYKKNNKKIIDIKDIINLNNISKTAYNYLLNFRQIHAHMDNNILNIIFNKKNKITKYNATFVRKNISYTKDIYIIMMDFMISNINNKNNLPFLWM